MITQDELKRELTYDPITGYFIRNGSKTPTVIKGDRAGSVNGQGYRQIFVCGKYYSEHTLVWIYMYGTYPVYQIDHINHDKEDNSFLNLRDIPHDLNVKNKPKYSSNKSGTTGVIWDKCANKWMAFITVKCKRKNLGRFVNLIDAIAVRKNEQELLGFHVNHGV